MSSTGHLSELDLLRGQVADLSRELAERDRSAQHQREQSDLLRAIVKGAGAETGEAFFSALVTHLTSVLHVKYAFIGEVQGDHIRKIRTLAVSAGGAIVDNFEYALAHTPCASALTQSFACFDRGLQTMFPQFTRLADLGAESYCAVPLRTKGGAVMGLLVVMDTKPLQQGDDLQSLLEVFAPRVAAEFEWRRAEQERAQALADLHNVIETIPDIVFTLDTQGNVVKWNRRLGDVTGYSSEELLNKPALAFVPPEEQARTAAAIQRVFMEGYAELEGHLLTKEHHLIPYHWAGALLKNSHGEAVGITGIWRDVSEKKRAEEELQRQQRHLVEAQMLAHLGSWHWDVDSGKAQWSDEQYRIFGHEPSSISVTYDTFLIALFPDDRDRVLSAVSNALTGKVPYDIEYRIVRPNGDVRFLHGRAEVQRDVTGHPSSMAGTVLDITERKQVEEALRLSEERYRALYDDTPTMYFTLATDGTVRSVNRFGAEQLGYRVEELIGHSVLGLFHEQDKEAVAASLSECLATPAITRYWEFRKVGKDGNIIWVRETARVGQSSIGETVVLITCEDITERKQAEEAFRRSEERFRTMFTQAPIGMALIDSLTGQICEANSKFAQISGRTKEEISSLNWMSITHPDDVQTDLDNMAMLNAREIAGFQMEKRYIWPDGKVVWINLTVAPIQVEEYAGPRHLAMIEDITERKQAEQEQNRLIEDLTRSRQHFQALFNWTPSAVGISTVAEGRFIDVNEGFSLLTGYMREEVMGRTTLELGLWADLSERESVLREIREQGYLHNREGLLRIKSGEIRSLMVSVDSIQLGPTPCLIYLCHDITERKRMENALRTRERELQAALKERERISQDLHDGILQSLFAVGLNLEVVKSLMPPKTRKTSGASLDKAIDQLNRVLREIRNFIARLGPDPIEGKDLSTAVQSMLTSLTENQPTRVRLAVEKRAAQAVSAEQSFHLVRVIQEAVSNCIRHGGAQEARVSLKMLKQGVRLSIRDNGRGFNQNVAKGVGHGLANMAARAKKIGGRFTVLSKENEGTRIVLDLPKEASNASR